MTETCKEVVAILKDYTSTSPLSFRDLLAKLPAPSADIESALTTLYENKIINRCYLTKNGWTDNMYWPTAKASQPALWSAFKINTHKTIPPPRRNEAKPIEVAKVQPTIIEDKPTMVDATKQLTKAQLVRLSIEDTPGITHEELIRKVIGDINDELEMRKASDIIGYVIKQGGYTLHNDLNYLPLKMTKRYWSNEAYKQRKESMAVNAPVIAESQAPAKAVLTAENIVIPTKVTVEPANSAFRCALFSDETLVIETPNHGLIHLCKSDTETLINYIDNYNA